MTDFILYFYAWSLGNSIQFNVYFHIFVNLYQAFPYNTNNLLRVLWY